MAVRKVVTRRSRNVRGYMPSFKLGCAVPWESQNELRLLRLLELSGAVSTYDVQPSVETIEVGGEPQIYFPDVQVRYTNGRVVTLEVKPVARLRTPKVAARMQAFEGQCKEQGREFFVITDEQLSVEPRSQNAEELMYHRRPMERALRHDIMNKIDSVTPSTVGELRELIGIQLAALALGLGLVGVNLDEVISCESILQPNGGHYYADLHS